MHDNLAVNKRHLRRLRHGGQYHCLPIPVAVPWLFLLLGAAHLPLIIPVQPVDAAVTASSTIAAPATPQSSSNPNANHHCQTICVLTGGGRAAEYLEDTNLCKCWLPMTASTTSGSIIDDAKEAIMQASASQHGMLLQVVKEVDKGVEMNSTITSDMTTIPTPDGKVVGTVQGLHHRRHHHHHHHHHPLHHRLRVPPQPITPEVQRQLMGQIGTHLARLNDFTDPRARQVELEAMRALLRQLSRSVVVPNPANMRASRLRTLAHQAHQRQMLNRHRLITQPTINLP